MPPVGLSTFACDEITENEFTQSDVKKENHCWNNMNLWLFAHLCSWDLNGHIQLMSAITSFLSQLVNIC